MAIYKEKNKKKYSKDGRSWYFRTYYNDLNGNRKQKTSKMFLTKAEAQDAERTFLMNYEKQKDLDFESLTLIYLKEYKKKNKEETYENTKNRITKHILPVFKKTMVSKISIIQFEEMKNNISKLNIKTQNSVITYFKSILRTGIEIYDLNIPIFNKIKTIQCGVTPPKEYQVWNLDEYKQFINQVDDLEYKTLFSLLYFAGLRIGELQALKWKDYNNKIIDINKSYNKSGKITTPKTSNSYRKVDIPNNVIKLLDDLYIQKSKIYGFNNEMFIFGDIVPLSRTTITRKKESYIKKANVKRITIHEFRHSHVTLLRSMNYTIKQVATRIGDTETTVIETYSHLFESDKFVISEGLNKLEL